MLKTVIVEKRRRERRTMAAAEVWAWSGWMIVSGPCIVMQKSYLMCAKGKD